MRVLLSTYGSRGDVEPLVGLAVRLRALGAEVRVCAPPEAGAPQVVVPQVRHAGPDALLRAMVASGLKSELMT